MTNAELAEIRARLRAVAEQQEERPRSFLSRIVKPKAKPSRAAPVVLDSLAEAPRLPTLSAPAPVITAPPAPPPAAVQPEASAPRRRLKFVADAAPPVELASPALRRQAFGQRPEAAIELMTRPEDLELGPAFDRLGALLTRALPEIPFLPEDLADPTHGDADRLLAASGVVEHGSELDPAASDDSAPEQAADDRPLTANDPEAKALVQDGPGWLLSPDVADDCDQSVLGRLEMALRYEQARLAGLIATAA